MVSRNLRPFPGHGAADRKTSPSSPCGFVDPRRDWQAARILQRHRGRTGQAWPYRARQARPQGFPAPDARLMQAVADFFHHRQDGFDDDAEELGDLHHPERDDAAERSASAERAGHVTVPFSGRCEDIKSNVPGSGGTGHISNPDIFQTTLWPAMSRGIIAGAKQRWSHKSEISLSALSRLTWPMKPPAPRASSPCSTAWANLTGGSSSSLSNRPCSPG